jgi:hypothetical protein
MNRRFRRAVLAVLATAGLATAAAPAAGASVGHAAAPVALAVAPAVAPVAATPLLGTPAPRRPHPHRKPWPITLTVRTLPALPNARVAFDGHVARTDDRGVARFTQQHNFRPHTLQLLDVSRAGPAQRLRFVRWAGQRDPDQAFRPTVTGLPMRTSYTVTAAFAVQYPVTPRLVDRAGAAVDPDRVSAVRIRSATGTLLDVPVSGRIWLDGVVPVYRGSTIALTREKYSLQSVMVSGANTVDAGQIVFQPVEDRSPTFVAKFFSLSVGAHDMLFKNAAGRAARITYPDGTVHTVPFSARGRVALHGLPRGRYLISLDGGGTPIPRELLLSRDTEVDLPVATHRDYGALGGSALALAVGLLLVGRGRQRVRRVIWRSAGRPGRGGREPVTDPPGRPASGGSPA